jgi:hypothetical protein
LSAVQERSQLQQQEGKCDRLTMLMRKVRGQFKSLRYALNDACSLCNAFGVLNMVGVTSDLALHSGLPAACDAVRVQCMYPNQNALHHLTGGPIRLPLCAGCYSICCA